MVPFLVFNEHFEGVEKQHGFTKLNQSLLDVYSKNINSFHSSSIPSIGSKIHSYSSSDILVSPGSGSGCSGHGRFSEDSSDSAGSVEVQSSVDEVGEVVSVNPSLGLGLALVRLTALYGADQNTSTKRLFIVGSNTKAPITFFQPMWWPQALDPQTGKVSV